MTTAFELRSTEQINCTLIAQSWETAVSCPLGVSVNRMTVNHWDDMIDKRWRTAAQCGSLGDCDCTGCWYPWHWFCTVKVRPRILYALALALALCRMWEYSHLSLLACTATTLNQLIWRACSDKNRTYIFDHVADSKIFFISLRITPMRCNTRLQFRTCPKRLKIMLSEFCPEHYQNEYK